MFGDGSFAECTLLVGADGSKSVFRNQLLPNHKIMDTSSGVIYGKPPLTPKVIKSLGPKIMSSMSAMEDRTQSLLLMMILERITFQHGAEVKKDRLRCPGGCLFWDTASQLSVLGLPEDQVPHMGYEDSQKSHSLSWRPGIPHYVRGRGPTSSQMSVLHINSCEPCFVHWEPNEQVTYSERRSQSDYGCRTRCNHCAENCLPFVPNARRGWPE